MSRSYQKHQNKVTARVHATRIKKKILCSAIFRENLKEKEFFLLHCNAEKIYLHFPRNGKVAQVFRKLRNVKVGFSKNTFLNLEIFETETVYLDAMLPSQNQQDVIKISRGDEEKNSVTNLENKCLPDLQNEAVRNNKILKEAVNDGCQQILKSNYKMCHRLVDILLSQHLIFRNEICSSITYWKLSVHCCINCTKNSNINCSKSKINCYNSLFHGRTNDHVQMQICNKYKYFEKELIVNVSPCQQKPNGIYCRV